MRDITLEETVYFMFTTRAFASGVPTTLAGSPVLSVLESNNATPITSGVSVSVDRASVTGLNQATVVATAANGYEAGKSYAVYISTGTVGGVSVVGEVVAQFSVQASSAFTRLGAPAGASVSADVAAVKAVLPSALVSGRIDASVGAYQTGLTPLQPATAGRTLVVDAAGLADANVVKLGPTGSGTAQTARDIGLSVLVGDKTGFSISGTTQTLDALQTAQNSAHGAGSWATATGFSTHTAADVWAVGTRSLTTFGTLVSDVATAVWAAGTRTLTGFGTLVADTVTAVWSAVSRTITGTVVLDATQGSYAPAKAGDAMTLTGPYDAAKTAAQPGDAMSLTTPTGNALVAATAAAITVDHGSGSYVRNTEPATPPTADAIADEVQTRTLNADVKKVNGVTIVGDGSATPFNA